MNLTLEFGAITLNIDQNVIEKFKMFIQNDALKNESGGILTGYMIDKYSFHITDLSLPSMFDISSRYSFTRSKTSAQKFINCIFEKSKGRKIYLGEWHTHPESIPHPSIQDSQSFIQQLTANKLHSPIAFMIIVGIEELYIELYFNKKSIEHININFTINGQINNLSGNVN